LLKTSVIVGAIIIILLTSSTIAAAFATALGPSDFPDHPERYCVSYGDTDLQRCADVDICDEEGEVKPDDKFCTGKAIRNPPGPESCPEGFHWTEDDESGLCYTNVGGCEYDDLTFNKDKTGCIDVDFCKMFPNSRECLDKDTHCNLYPNADYCKSDEDKCQSQLVGSRCNDASHENSLNSILDLSQYSNGKQVDCGDNPDHPFCNGKRGQDCVIFCELRDKLEDDMQLSCWDNDDVPKDDPRAYCAYDPETKEDCKIN
jgi:hypothetical protein